MARRGRMSRGHSKYVFRKGVRVHGRNNMVSGAPMRGGIRL